MSTIQAHPHGPDAVSHAQTGADSSKKIDGGSDGASSAVVELSLRAASALGDVESVRHHVSRGHAADDPDHTGRTPLMWACRGGHLEVARLLLQAGADPHRATAGGTTCLMFAKTAAVGNGDTRLLQLLLEQGCEINARDINGRTALDYLVDHARTVEQFLCSAGAEI